MTARIVRTPDATLGRLPLGIVRLRADGSVAFANPAAVRMLTPLGEPHAVLHDPPLGPHVERLLARAAPLPPTLVPLRPDQTLRISGSGPRGDEPALLVLDDVTSLLRVADAQTTFVRNAAHQLRTPVTGISTAIEVLRAGAQDDPDERDRFLAHMAEQTERLAALTRALLVLARAQAGTQAPRLQRVVVAALLERLVRELPRPDAIAVEIDAPPDLAAFVEPDLLHEALRALAENAVRHAHAGRVALRARRREARRVEIEVADDGDGIVAEHLDQIFEPFFRLVEDNAGFGLGLSIARQAVAAMGGELRIDSAPRAGTRVTVQIPSAEPRPA